MSYIIVHDMVERFGSGELTELTDRQSEGVMDTDIIDAAIADASAEIDGYITAIVTTPLATVPANIKRMTGDIARYRLYDDKAPDEVRTRYDDAIAFLKWVVEGNGSLGVGDTPGSSVIDYEANTRVFTEETLEGF